METSVALMSSVSGRQMRMDSSSAVISSDSSGARLSSDLLDTDVMQRLNAEVDLKHREYKEVAAEFLKEKGFVVTN